jgi:DNA-binding ferritin-like protein
MRNSSKRLLHENQDKGQQELARHAALKLLQGEVRVYDGKGYQYADLAVWLAFMRSLLMMHHTHHWQTVGNYGDHLLFEKLYKNVEGELDALGEKIIGLDSPELTSYFLQLEHMKKFMKLLADKSQTPLEVSLKAEYCFIIMGEFILNHLQETNAKTVGLENLIGDILDRHESHVYLLQQRLVFSF